MEINVLTSKIKEARDAYYNGSSIMPDCAYDGLLSLLQKLDPNNPILFLVGVKPVSNWDKYSHKVEMGSLNKCNTDEEFQDWYNKYCKGEDIFVADKLDGLSISLVYENHNLSIASSRGNSIIGENIIINVMKMKNVPLTIPIANATIRGEIVIHNDTLALHFPEYKNSRNGASGISRRYDGEGSEHLNVYCYQIITDEDIKTETDQMSLLKEWGFATPNYSIVEAKNISSYVVNYNNNIRKTLPYDIDGLVLRNNSISKQNEFGSLNQRPRAAIAYKFEAESFSTIIKDVIFQVGNSGRITPVAIVEPVDIVGATIERASLYNNSFIEEMNITIGGIVEIIRANDIIPKISAVLSSTDNKVVFPTECPICKSILVSKGEYIQCENDFCPAIIKGRILNWINELNILEWGDGLVDKIVEANLVKTVPDLYRLTEDTLSKVDRMGKKSAKNCITSLRSNLSLSLEQFIGALSINMIGSSTMKLVTAAGYNTFDKLYTAHSSNFASIHGLGPVKANSLYNGLQENKELISELLSLGLTIKEKSTGALTDASVCFTGKSTLPRKELEKLAQAAGAIVKSSVTNGLTYLVMADADSTSSKAVQARKLGTKCISEEVFMDIIRKLKT